MEKVVFLRRTLQRPATTSRAPRPWSPPWRVLLALLLAASPARAVRVTEFGVACYDGSARISWIELAGNADERFDHAIGIRTLDRAGTVLWEAPDVYIKLSGAGGPISWFDPTRRLGITTAETVDRLGMDPRSCPDLLMGTPLDTLAGTIVLFKGSATLQRIDYGEGRAVQAPPPGTSMLRGSTSWAIETSPRINTMFDGGTGFPALDHEGCLGAPSWSISGLMTRCVDGSTGGQYIELVARGGGVIDPSILVRVLDHAGQLLDEFTPFQSLIGQPIHDGENWLIGGPSFEPGTLLSPDVALPVALDPMGGTIEVGGTFRGVHWTQDVFVYGSSAVPAPAAGYAYARRAGQALTLTLPAPRNSMGAAQVPLGCGFDPYAPFIRELSLACASGSTTGQFVEIGLLSGEITLDGSYDLSAFDHTGTLLFSMPAVFGSLAGRVVGPSNGVLISAPGPEPRPRADVQMPALLDPVAGRIALARNVGGVSGTIASLSYGTSEHPRPPDGTSLDSDDARTYQLRSYPTPAGLLGPAPLENCEYVDGPPSVVPRQIGIACRDGSDAGLFLELFAAGGTHSVDSNLGLRLVTDDAAPPSTIFPLLPPGSAPMPAGGHRLWASAGFASRTGSAPDEVLPALAKPPREVRIFRRDPLTALDQDVDDDALPIGSLSPGHGYLRDESGRYAEIVGPTPVRADGLTIVDTDCYPPARPDEVRVRELLLRCRDGGDDAQYVALGSTGPDAVTSAGLSLRAFDAGGARLFDIAVPTVWPGGPEPRWPESVIVIGGGPGFRERMGISPDMTLPAKLDSVGGRLELVLREAGAERVVDQVAYGTQGASLPIPGASLEWTPDGFVPDERPNPSNSNGESARSECLGACADRRLIVAGRDQYQGSDAQAEVGFLGARAGYDAARGTFQLRSGTTSAAAELPDRFHVVGLPDGTPVTVRMSIRMAATASRMCGNGCAGPSAGLWMSSGTSTDSTTFTDSGVRDLAWVRDVRAGEDFDVDLRPTVVADSLEGETASLLGRLEVGELAPGARLVSCLGFDSERARPVGTGTIASMAGGIRISWHVDPSVVSSGTLDRASGPDRWQAVDARAPDANGLLEFMIPNAPAGQTDTYCLSWTDQFGTNFSPALTVGPDAAPVLSLDGVYPNPSTGVLSAHVRIPTAGIVRLEALDVAGRIVASQSAWRTAGTYQVPISPGHAFAPGVYVVRLHFQGSVVRTTAIVLR